MKKRRVNYRKIYELHHGIIPVDENGRVYDIHHIDGNRDNNDITNLVALSVQEHYNIHYAQGDHYACLLISKDMKISSEEKSRLAREAVRKQIEAGTHNFLGGALTRKMNADRIKQGTHKFLNLKWQLDKAHRQIEAGTHNFCGGDIQKNRIVAGTHNFLSNTYAKQQLENGTHNFQGPNSPAQYVWHCEHCDKTGRGKGNYSRCHGDKCKERKLT